MTYKSALIYSLIAFAATGAWIVNDMGKQADKVNILVAKGMTPEAAVKANQKANYDAAHPAPGPRTKHEDCINNFYAFTAINPWMDGGSAGWNHTLSRAELACYEVKN